MNKSASSTKSKLRKKSLPVSRELHDGVCQTLTAVQLLAKVLLRKMETEKSSELSSMRELNGLLQKARVELGEILRDFREEKHDRS